MSQKKDEVEIYRENNSVGNFVDKAVDASFPKVKGAFAGFFAPTAEEVIQNQKLKNEFIEVVTETQRRMVDLEFASEEQRLKKEADIQAARTALLKQNLSEKKGSQIVDLQDAEHELAIAKIKAEREAIERITRGADTEYDLNIKDKELRNQAFEIRMNRKPPEPVSASFLPVQVVRLADEIIRLENQDKQNQQNKTSDEDLFRKIQLAYKELELLCRENGIDSIDVIHRVRNAT